MFTEKQTPDKQEYYAQLLKSLGSLSRLFSESPEPYIEYRFAENLFCRSFEAENLSRSDTPADASKDGVGFGIKTFLYKNGKTLEKIAEFNSEHQNFNQLKEDEKVAKIASLRNDRFETTKRIFGLNEIIYHCVTRQAGKIIVYETPAPEIDVKKIKNCKVHGNTIHFSDQHSDYSFNVTKSVLYKRFVAPTNPILDIPVRILEDPFSHIEKSFEKVGPIFMPIKKQPHVFLPLYSTRNMEDKHVPEKSGLNQWNASGRPRDPNEIYIPIPRWIHKKFPTFFPARDKPFELILPNKKTITAKVCQENEKALMSNPNSAIGEWILREVLNLKEKELLTYEKLESIGLDTVVIYKIDRDTYDIDFTKIGSYERFLSEHLSEDV